jgi:hypothetical protein
VDQGHQRARYTDAQVARARVLREAGWSLGTIAAELRVNSRTLADWVSYRTREFA